MYPYLIYGVEIWGNACNVYLHPLTKLQKKCLRIITFLSYLEHTEPFFQKLEILNFKKLVIHRITMLVFTNSRQIVPIAIHMLFARNVQYHNYNTRQSRSLHPSVGRGEAIYRSFSFHGVNIWNYLSKHIPVNVTYTRFNKLTKAYLLNNNMTYRLVYRYDIQYMFVYCFIIIVAPTYWGIFFYFFIFFYFLYFIICFCY